MTASATRVVITLAPNPAHFGDLVTAHVTGPAAAANFAPFAIRSHHGADYVLQCLDPVCVPGPGSVTVAPKRLRAVVAPRATAAEVQRPLRSFHRETAAPPPSYAVAPAALEGVAFFLAFACVVAAVAVAWPLVRRLVPEPVDDRTPLERALALVRASLRREPDERRRALDVLARVAPAGPLQADALDLAWSESDPEPSRVSTLVDRVEGRT